MKEKFIYNFCKKTVDKSILIVYSSCYDKVVVLNGSLIFLLKILTAWRPNINRLKNARYFFSYKRIKI